MPQFESLKGAILDDYLEYQAKEQLKEKLQAAKAALGDTSFKDLQKTFEGEFFQTGWLDPSDTDSMKSLQDRGIPVSEMLQLEKSGSVVTHLADEHGFLIRLDEITPFDSEDFNQKKNEISEALEQERMQQYLDGFVASLHRNAKIETNETVATPQE